MNKKRRSATEVFQATSASNKKSITSKDAEEIAVDIDLGPFVRPGIYNLAFLEYRTALMWGRVPKLELRFKIVDQGEYYETEVSRWYNVRQIKGRPKKSGDFIPGPRSDFVREYLTLFPVQLQRLDRISFQPFRQTIVRGRIEKVKGNFRQKNLPESMQYSIVSELLEAGA